MFIANLSFTKIADTNIWMKKNPTHKMKTKLTIFFGKIEDEIKLIRWEFLLIRFEFIR